MQLRPGEQFTIVRQLDNPADTGTYYVQAVIRNSKTDAIIATINLDDKGDQRFTKNWQVASDSSGLGLYIDIESRVFTDSGYTTYSDIYAKENKVYLIDERNAPGGGSGVDFGTDVDYVKIRRIFKEELGDQKPAKKEKVDLSPILDKIIALRAEIKEIKPEKTDISPILDALKQFSAKMGTMKTEIEKSIADKEVTSETDLTPLMNKIDVLDPKSLVEDVNALVDKIKEVLLTDVEKVSKQVSDMHDMIARAPFIPLPSESIGKVELEKPTKRIRKQS